MRSQGRWWYFPAVFVAKTPLVVLLLLPWAIVQAKRQGAWKGPWPALIGLTLTVYLTMAMTSNYNLGVRHLLPVIPLIPL